MTARNPESSELWSIERWHALYRAALFENDPLKITNRIVQAQRVLTRRARQLFMASGDKIQERAVDHTQFALSAQRDSLKSNKKSP